jgi:small subunit ribosomal protein S2
MGGIKKMTKLPGAVFCVSVIEDNLAIKEAKNKGIPIVALCDTNVSSEGIEFPIPANEDAVSSLRLMMGYIVKAVLEGKGKSKNEKTEAKKNEGGKL